MLKLIWRLCSSEHSRRHICSTVIPFTIHNTHWHTYGNNNMRRPQIQKWIFHALPSSSLSTADAISTFTRTHFKLKTTSRFISCAQPAFLLCPYRSLLTRSIYIFPTRKTQTMHSTNTQRHQKPFSNTHFSVPYTRCAAMDEGGKHIANRLSKFPSKCRTE